MTIEELFDYSERSGFLYMPPETAQGLEGVSVQLPSGLCAWTVDERNLTRPERKRRIGHEIGHCATGSFYTRLSAPTTREKCEETARRWQYRNQVKLEDLYAALRYGCREAWEIAEYLDLPEPMIRKAVEYYCAVLGDHFKVSCASRYKRKTLS